jgi:putative endonuclease
MTETPFYLYIMTNKYNTVFYTGVTSDLTRRVQEHKGRLVKGFTKKYNLDKLVYYELLDDAMSANIREKQIKGGSRQKKIDLINSKNKEWKDLSVELSISI